MGWPFRVVADTQVFVAAVYPEKTRAAEAAGFQIPPGEEFFLRATGRNFQLVSSLACTLELAEKLEDLGVPDELSRQLLEAVMAISEGVEVTRNPPLCEDPDDDKFIWVAMEGEASHLVSHDKAVHRATQGMAFKTVQTVGFLRELREEMKSRGISRDLS